MAVTQEQRKAAKEELRRRARIELAARQAVKDRILDDLHAKQREVLECISQGERFISLCTSRRAGKTYLLASLIILKLLDAGFGQAVFFVAQTMTIGKGLIFKDLVRLIEEYQLPWTLKEHAGVIETPAGASFRIIGMDKSTQTGKTRGFKIIGCFTDEVQEYPHLIQDFFEATTPALADFAGLFVCSGTPGPAKQGTWYKISHAKDEYQRFKGFHWSIRDNTKFPRDPEEVLKEELENGGYTWDHPYFQREYLGIWAESHSLNVFEFLTNRNTFTELPAGYGLHWTHVLGLDYGYNDDTAWTVVAMCPHTTKKYILVSEKQSGLIADQAVERTAALVQLYGLRRVVVDPSGGGKPFYEQFNRRYSKTLGCSIRPAHKAAGSVEASIHIANTELRTGRLLLHADGARPLIEELQKLRYKDETREEILSGAEYPDHCFVAGTLVATSKGQVPIEQVRAGDLVWTRKGLCRVRRAWCSGVRRIYELRTKHGRSLAGTIDHPVWSGDDWKELGQLVEGDELTCLDPKLLCLLEETTEDTRTQRLHHIENTTDATRAGESAIYTGTFGRVFTALFHRSITSITRMMMSTTTTSPTLSASQALFTFVSTPQTRPRRRCTERTSSMPLRQLQPGTGLRRDWPGIPRTDAMFGKVVSQPIGFAGIAEGGTDLAPFNPTLYFAATTANRQPDASRGSMTLLESAHGVAKPLWSIATQTPNVVQDHVARVTEKGRELPVYDLEVDECHEFFANGILVHNCADSARYCLAELMGLRGKPRPDDMTPEERARQEEKWLLERHQAGSGSAGFGGGRF